MPFSSHIGWAVKVVGSCLHNKRGYCRDAGNNCAIQSYVHTLHYSTLNQVVHSLRLSVTH